MREESIEMQLQRCNYRDAITEQTLVQAHNRLKDFANGDGVQSLLTDVDGIYSDELQQLGFTGEMIGARIKNVEDVSQNGHMGIKDEFIDWQEFEFDVVHCEPNVKQIKQQLEIFTPEKLTIYKIPFVRAVFEKTTDCIAQRLKLSDGEKDKFKNYLQRREAVLAKNSCRVTKMNRIVLANDIGQIESLYKWAPLRVTINGLDDPDEIEEILESTYEEIIGGSIDFIRIESNLSEDEISIGVYSKLFSI